MRWDSNIHVYHHLDLTTDVTKEVSEILSMGEVMQYLLESARPFANVSTELC